MLLYQPLLLRKLALPNRWVMSPMCMYSSENGLANDFHLVHYGSRAQGGVGLVMIEATAVNPKGRITTKCMSIWNDEQAKSLKKIVDFVHENAESKIGIQLAHSGRKGSTWNGHQISAEEGWETEAPSAIPYQESDRIPHELSIIEIKTLIEDFKNAAIRALNSGFDLVEIHAAHGYLIHQFLSPLSNTRTDEYGGSFENRIRFLIEVVDNVNSVLDEQHPLLVRISASEYSENGWDVEDSIRLSKILKEHHVDLIDVSSGGNIHGAKITLFNGYQIPFSEKIRKEASVKTAGVGLIKTAVQAEEILRNQQADLIFVGREILRNPYIPTITAMEKGEDCFFTEQYTRAKLNPNTLL